jgi:hypothetical protein
MLTGQELSIQIILFLLLVHLLVYEDRLPHHEIEKIETMKQKERIRRLQKFWVSLG